MGKCCPHFSCPDTTEHQRLGIISMLKRLHTALHKKQPKNSCTQADFRQILKFTYYCLTTMSQQFYSIASSEKVCEDVRRLVNVITSTCIAVHVLNQGVLMHQISI